MTSKRIGIFAGGALAGALLLGTAGLALAQDPSPSPTTPSRGPGMMGGGAGMMGGGSGMMGGGSGMMGGQAGRMNLTADQWKQMDALHDQMIASGTCDPAQMQQFHGQLQSGK